VELRVIKQVGSLSLFKYNPFGDLFWVKVEFVKNRPDEYAR
jgi:hypothetical protein